MNQPGMVIGDQSSVAVTAVPYFQPPTIITAGGLVRTTSCPLVGFGVTLTILSIASVGLSSWLMNLSNNAIFANVSLGCGLIFLGLSLLAMYGGSDVGSRQYAIIWCLVLGILGLFVALASIAFNLMALGDYPSQCSVCKAKLNLSTTGVRIEAGCSAMCTIAYLPAHMALVFLAAFEGIIGFILSIAACCNACSCCCCYKEARPQGYVLQSPVTATQYSVTTNPSVPYRPLESEPSAPYY